jgi:hypothetical protein
VIAMPAFRFFDPWAALDHANAPATSAKAANPAKVGEGEAETLAALAALAALTPEIEISALKSVEADMLALPAWFEHSAAPVPGEPAFDLPCSARRGRNDRRGPMHLHFCLKCGAWGAYGYGVTGDLPGRWYCRDHRPGSAP